MKMCTQLPLDLESEISTRGEYTDSDGVWRNRLLAAVLCPVTSPRDRWSMVVSLLRHNIWSPRLELENGYTIVCERRTADAVPARMSSGIVNT
jgi:hypothetical protein